MSILKNTGRRLELYLHDEIGPWGTEATEVIEALNSEDSSLPLEVFINSPGGGVFDGLAIFNYLKRWPGGVNVTIDGLAASIASVIAMAGDTVTANDGAMMMIHNVWTIGVGNSGVFAKLSEDLGKMDLSLASIYAKKTGLSNAKVKEMMANETWIMVEDGLESGFFDAKKEEKAQILASNLSDFGYKNVPNSLKNAVKDIQAEAFTIRKAEKDLRDAGWSRKSAKIVASRGFGALEEDNKAEREALAEDEFSNLLKTILS